MSGSSAMGGTGFLWTEEGEQRQGLIAEVAPLAFGAGSPHVFRTYSYAVPQEMEESLAVGQRVMVPLGRSGRQVRGFIVGLDRGPWDSTLRPVASVVDATSFLTSELIDLGKEIAEHYCCSLSQTLKAMTPEAVRQGRGLKRSRHARLTRPVDQILADGPPLSKGGKGGRIGTKRRALLDILAKEAEPVLVERLLTQSGASAAILRAVVKAGWVEVLTRKSLDEAAEHPTHLRQAGHLRKTADLVEPSFELNEEQRAAVEKIIRAIDKGGFQATLLFGVSGSGKTEVYIRSIRRVLALGRQAMLLVPEIMLTTQLLQRLSTRLPEIAVIHSGMTEVQRARTWRQVAAGDKKVVLGTRSAVFAPCPNLGLICVDEEQETSYKNLQAPRFHVRDVAIMRCKRLQIPVVLGSATPALETWYHSIHRRDYQRVTLGHRVKNLPLPVVQIVDMGEEHREQRKPVALSRLLMHLMNATLERGEQALILVNRRGFANRIFCPACNTRITCPSCNVNLVVHVSSGMAVCHYCRRRIKTPTICPNAECGEKLVQSGLGTQRLERILEARFPSARIQRVDSDTMKHRRHYQAILDDFSARRIDVLVGTQMIAKGLDFPFVSFVGVIHGDVGGFAGDFRSQERLFQLITQVAGRAGRAEVAGRVVVQTMTPDLPALRLALRHDYEAFATQELPLRQRVGLPPFRRLARIVLSHPRQETVRQEAEALNGRVREAIDTLGLELADTLGPSPCVLPRLRGRYRYELLVRTAGASAMRKLTHHLSTLGKLRTKADSMVIDVDPVSLA